MENGPRLARRAYFEVVGTSVSKGQCAKALAYVEECIVLLCYVYCVLCSGVGLQHVSVSVRVNIASVAWTLTSVSRNTSQTRGRP